MQVVGSIDFHLRRLMARIKRVGVEHRYGCLEGERRAVTFDLNP